MLVSLIDGLQRHPPPFHREYRAAKGCSSPLMTFEIIPSNCGKKEDVKGKKNGGRYWSAREVPIHE